MPTFTQLTPQDREHMLRTIGIDRVEQLFADVPADARYPALELPPALTELEVSRHLADLAAQEGLALERRPAAAAGAPGREDARGLLPPPSQPARP